MGSIGSAIHLLTSFDVVDGMLWSLLYHLYPLSPCMGELLVVYTLNIVLPVLAGWTNFKTLFLCYVQLHWLADITVNFYPLSSSIYFDKQVLVLVDEGG